MDGRLPHAAMTGPCPRLSLAQPARYRILVQGSMGKGWEEWFEGMRLTHLELVEELPQTNADEGHPAEMTMLTGLVSDQAALLGILQKLYSFGLPILLLELISFEPIVE